MRHNFNPRAPRGARLFFCKRGYIAQKLFQSTCPARGTTAAPAYTQDKGHGFQSTCPARGTTPLASCICHSSTNFNPRAPRGARLTPTVIVDFTALISIHVPREGHDHDDGNAQLRWIDISIHVPREGHDPRIADATKKATAFQSTCPARGTTLIRLGHWKRLKKFQSTCPARGTTAP